MKIAIVGTGIAGLIAAWRLTNKHDVTVFESNSYIGGHTNTITVFDSKQELQVDTGFIVFNEKNYPGLCRIFDELEVETRESDMSFSVKCERSGLEYNGTSLRKLFAQPSNIFNKQFIRMLFEIMVLHRKMSASDIRRISDAITVIDYIKTQGYSDYFLEKYFIPLGASLWSCPAEQFLQFPVKFVLEFLENHSMLQVEGRPVWRTVVGGSRVYVEKLTKDFLDRIFVNSSVICIRRDHEKILVYLENGKSDIFDEVVMACHADQSLQLIKQPDNIEKEMLSHFEYQYNKAILHTDRSILPERRMAWASWNYRIPEEESQYTRVTYNMNMLQGMQSENTYCVSLNEQDYISPDSVIRTIDYHHPVFKPGRDNIQKEHEKLIRHGRVSYCGAYWGYGFHEDGVRSALKVAESFI